MRYASEEVDYRAKDEGSWEGVYGPTALGAGMDRAGSWHSTGL